MIDRLDQSLNFASTALSLRSHRQNILAANIANADTPGYQARDIDFSKQLQKALSSHSSATHALRLSLTSTQHIAGTAATSSAAPLLYRVPDQPSADGNTVDMDRERVQFADNSLKYQTDLTYLSNQIKWMSNVIQG